MWKFLVRRLLLGLLIVVLGAMVTYIVIRCLPSSYMEKMARQYAAASNGRLRWQDLLDDLNKQYGSAIKERRGTCFRTFPMSNLRCRGGLAV